MNNWNQDKRKRKDPITETATKSAPKPGEYPIGSVQSRAAARMMLENKSKPEMVIRVVYVGGSKENRPPLLATKRVPGSSIVVEYCYEEDTDAEKTNGLQVRN
jgi:hypothetical protein